MLLLLLHSSRGRQKALTDDDMRNFSLVNMLQVAELIDRGVTLTIELKKQIGGKLKDFRSVIGTNPPKELLELKADAESFAKSFAPVGFNYDSMVYKD